MKPGNNLFHALLNPRTSDFSLPQFEQILIFCPLLFMNLSAKSGNFLFPRNSVCDCGGRVFPLLAARFSLGEDQRTTTINFSSSQNCILQTEKMEKEKGAKEEHKNSHFVHFRPTSNAFLLPRPTISIPIPFSRSGLWIPVAVFPYFRLLYSLK